MAKKKKAAKKGAAAKRATLARQLNRGIRKAAGMTGSSQG